MTATRFATLCHVIGLRSCLYAAIALAAATSSAGAADSFKPQRVVVSGSDDTAWVVASSAPGKDDIPETRFWVASYDNASNADALPSPSYKLLPVIGDPIGVAADDSALRVLYADLSLWQLEPQSTPTPGALYSSECDVAPLAMTGDAMADVSWFLVESSNLIERRPVATSRAVDENDNDRTDTPTTNPTITAPGLTLLRLDRGFWHRVPVPPAAKDHQDYRLAARDGAIHLFWRDRGRVIYHMQYRDEEWSLPLVAMDDAPIERYWAGALRSGPVLIVASPVPGQTGLHLSIARPGKGVWTLSKPIRPGSKKLIVPRDGVSAAVIGDRLGIAYIENDGIQFGWADLGQSPTARIASLSMETPQAGPPEQTWRDAAQTIIMLSILSFVIFTRRDQIQTPAVVPQGFVIAAVWRRVLATAVDLGPAVIAAYLLFYDFLLPLRNAGAFQEAVENPANAVKFELIRLVIVAIYGAWCLILEVLGQSTLGKRIVGCQVMAANGTAPTTRQLLVRNAIRILVFAMGPSGVLITFLVMALFTRNRQRLGDILAGTIVVQQLPEWPLDGDAPTEDRDEPERDE